MWSSKISRHESVWISSPLFDLFFMFGGLFVACLFLFFDSALDIREIRATKTVTAMLLSGGHLFAPFLLLLFSKKELALARANDPKLNSRMLILLLIPVLLYGTSAVLFNIQFGGPSPWQFNIRWPIILMGIFWFTWNSWHFGMQHFGILQIYRSKCGTASPVTRKLDYAVCIFVGFIVPHAILLSSPLFSPPIPAIREFTELLRMTLPSLLAVVAFVAIYMVYRVSKETKLSAPLLLAYFSLFAQAYMIQHLPILYVTLAYSATHWLQEIFLIGQIYSKQKTGTARTRYILFFASFLVLGLFSIGHSAIFQIPFVDRFRISSVGMIHGLESLTPEFFFLITAIFAILMFFSIGHFYLDRLIYKGRRW